MYPHLSKLLNVAEAIGSIETVDMTKDGPYTRDKIEISGVTPEGREFTLELELKRKKDENS